MAFTYFFRDLHTLELTVKHLIPFISGRSKIRVWDAGCANGPEPYTIAILFSENMGRFAFKNLKILATDIDSSNLFGDIIDKGIYPESDLKRIPRDLFHKYFRNSEKSGFYQIEHSIQDRLTYQKHDLLSLNPIGDGFSLVVCKNVLLHFKYEQRIDVIRMFHKVLAPGGFLSMEQTQKLPEELNHLFEHVTPDGQLYKKV